MLVAAVVMFGTAQREAQQPPDGAALAEFDRRVKAYADLRDGLAKGAAKLTETSSPEAIQAAERALALRIRAARPEAAQGDIFTPEAEERVRALLNLTMQGVRGKNTRGVIHDEGPGPGAFPLEVNEKYPEKEPLGTVPTNILATLPPLPENLEYRFVGRHLIIRDTRANIIVDYIQNAIP
jgi:hypothetical protein